MSFGKACAAVPAFAVVAGVQCGPPCGGLTGLGANLARRGRFRGRWRRYGWRLVCTLAALLGARWRPVCGPCGWWLSCGLSVLLAWPLRAARGWRWRSLIGCAWSLPPLRFGPLQWPPLRSLVHLSSAPAAVALVRAVVALRWWHGQIVKERARLALLALPLVWWPWRESNPRRRWRSPMVTAVALAGR